MNPIVHALKILHPDKTSRLYHRYWCPGCDSLHQITINPDKNGKGAGWDFSGTLERPTYSPSQLTRWSQSVGEQRKEFVCHTFIRDGRIEFLPDSTHALAGKTVDLPPLPDWVIRDRGGHPE